jgi:hypothetical protein
VNAQSEHAVQLTDKVELVVTKKCGGRGQDERRKSAGVQEDRYRLFQKILSTEPGKVVMLNIFSTATNLLSCLYQDVHLLSVPV